MAGAGQPGGARGEQGWGWGALGQEQGSRGKVREYSRNEEIKRKGMGEDVD